MWCDSAILIITRVIVVSLSTWWPQVLAAGATTVRFIGCRRSPHFHGPKSQSPAAGRHLNPRTVHAKQTTVAKDGVPIVLWCHSIAGVVCAPLGVVGSMSLRRPLDQLFLVVSAKQGYHGTKWLLLDCCCIINNSLRHAWSRCHAILHRLHWNHLVEQAVVLHLALECVCCTSG